MIEVRQLEKYYGDKHALKGISFTVQPGEILGFLGPNGAGKSTTVKILTGLIPASAGEARICGYSLSDQPLEVKKRFGYVPETGALYESLTAWEYLELLADLHHLDREVFEHRAGEFLELFDLQQDKNQRLAGFSKGMRQKVLIAAALLHNPEVLLFDEPLSGVDANTALVFKQLLRRFSEQGKTILFCSHVLEVVERLCTRIIIINEGEIVASGTPAAIAKQTGHATLEEAFNAITGGVDAQMRAEEFLLALEGLKE
ncbi:MAG: ABC transporter ATP-binding protein [candidate division KSB1 bacterium]|nr:ABC transporter ATP-binding protein [candidate division KSB1 bacterium]MDQ7064653.1 ABC transporter ATP-binding protein [candidate division KSB1 bacterium]